MTESRKAKIKLNVTTRKEVIALLGDPWIEELTIDGQLFLNWGYGEGSFIGGSRHRVFRVFFDENDVAVGTKNDIFEYYH